MLLSQKKMSLSLVQSNKKANDIHEGKWNGLGGKFEGGETPEECVIREVLEESGLSIQNPKYCGLLLFTNFKGNDWHVFVFTAMEFIGLRPYFLPADSGWEVFLSKIRT
jgi:8-oxo-dGTP diphosphatase